VRAFEVLFDDAHVVVVDKAAGVLTVPTPKRERNTLVAQLEKHLRTRLYVVHRLDRDTSGVLVFAKNERAGRTLVDRWHDDKVERHYDAIALGVIKEDRGTLQSRLLTGKGLQRRSARDDEGGEEAVTHFQVAQRVQGATLLDVTLETGRRNQIRVHLAEKGHPLLGDERYATGRGHPLWRERRLALHARSLTFLHPVTRAPVAVAAKTPEAFLRFLRAAR
jgi:23S rRNA pseudouridine1911/1915/1917 synthase